MANKKRVLVKGSIDMNGFGSEMPNLTPEQIKAMFDEIQGTFKSPLEEFLTEIVIDKVSESRDHPEVLFVDLWKTEDIN